VGFRGRCELAEGCRAVAGCLRWAAAPGPGQLQELPLQLALQERVLSISTPFLAAVLIIFLEIIVRVSTQNS